MKAYDVEDWPKIKIGTLQDSLEALEETTPEELLAGLNAGTVKLCKPEDHLALQWGKALQDSRTSTKDSQTGSPHGSAMVRDFGGISVISEQKLIQGIASLRQKKGAEHAVYIDPSSKHVTKVTNPGELGAEERGLSGYLQRLAWHNELLGDNVTVEGWVLMPGETAERLATTQPLRVPDPQRPEPTQKEIDVFMRAHNFLRAYDGAYIHESRDIAASDAVPKNFVREKSGAIHAVDVVLLQPSESMHSRLTAMAYNAPQVPQSALPAKSGVPADKSPKEK